PRMWLSRSQVPFIPPPSGRAELTSLGPFSAKSTLRECGRRALAGFRAEESVWLLECLDFEKLVRGHLLETIPTVNSVMGCSNGGSCRGAKRHRGAMLGPGTIND